MVMTIEDVSEMLRRQALALVVCGQLGLGAPQWSHRDGSWPY